MNGLQAFGLIILKAGSCLLFGSIRLDSHYIVEMKSTEQCLVSSVNNCCLLVESSLVLTTITVLLF
jgi:hypothetical protein